MPHTSSISTGSVNLAEIGNHGKTNGHSIRHANHSRSVSPSTNHSLGLNSVPLSSEDTVMAHVAKSTISPYSNLNMNHRLYLGTAGIRDGRRYWQPPHLVGGGRKKHTSVLQQAAAAAAASSSSSALPQSVQRREPESVKPMTAADVRTLLIGRGFTSFVCDMLVKQLSHPQMHWDGNFFKSIYNLTIGGNAQQDYNTLVLHLGSCTANVGMLQAEIIDYLGQLDDLNIDAKNPDLANAANELINKLREKIPNYVVYLAQLRKSMGEAVEKFRDAVNRHGEPQGITKFRRLLDDDLKKIEEELRMTHKVNKDSALQKYWDTHEILKKKFVADLNKLKGLTAPQPTDVEERIVIPSSLYEKFDPKAETPLTKSLLETAPAVNELRACVKKIEQLQSSISGMACHKTLATMHTDTLSSIGRKLELAHEKNIAATAEVDKAISNFRVTTYKLNASSTQELIEEQTRDRKRIGATTGPLSEINKALNEVTALQKESQTAHDNLRGIINQKMASDKNGAIRYENYFNITYGTRNLDEIFSTLQDRAMAAGVAIDPGIALTLAKMQENVDARNWKLAVTNASNVSGQLASLEKIVVHAEAGKKNYEANSATILKLAKNIRASCESWKLDKPLGDIDALQKAVRKFSGADDKADTDWTKASHKLNELKKHCEELEMVLKAIDDYKDVKNPTAPARLLPGTIHAIHQEISTDAQRPLKEDLFLAKLERAYKAQCAVDRETWLNVLGFSGTKVIDITETRHGTVFNDAVSKKFSSIDVHEKTTTILKQLFDIDKITDRFHVTTVVEKDGQEHRHHRYFDSETPRYSKELDSLPQEEQDDIRKTLDEDYDMMMAKFIQNIDALRANHGRPDSIRT
jgi:hypothetical protein